MRLTTALFLTLFLLPSVAFAGGDDIPVHVLKLTLLSDTDYVLVVSPIEKNDPVFGCNRFEVHGSFQRLDGVPWFMAFLYKGGPTKDSHLEALFYLKKFEGSQKTVRFGYMGYGFHPIDDKNLCVVESRALELSDGSVFSYWHEI